MGAALGTAGTRVDLPGPQLNASPLAALCAVAAASAALVNPALPAAHAQTDWQTCSFNGRSEACLVAGGSTSSTATFRSDSKQIEMEKVGEPWPPSGRHPPPSLWAAPRATPARFPIKSGRQSGYFR